MIRNHFPLALALALPLPLPLLRIQRDAVLRTASSTPLLERHTLLPVQGRKQPAHAGLPGSASCQSCGIGLVREVLGPRCLDLREIIGQGKEVGKARDSGG